MKKTIALSCILMASFLSSCNENSEKTEEAISETSMETPTETIPAESGKFCFKTETPYTTEDGTNLADVESLEFTVDGNAVTGKFEWIPAEKGGLSGEISGTKNGNVIEAVYNETYAEEAYPINLKIIVSADGAVVTSSDESFGTYTIKKSDCK